MRHYIELRHLITGWTVIEIYENTSRQVSCSFGSYVKAKLRKDFLSKPKNFVWALRQQRLLEWSPVKRAIYIDPHRTEFRAR